MARKKKYQQLYVYMNGVLVGTLERDSGYQVFTYAQDWLHNDISRPISLSMPLAEAPYKGQVVDYFFDNLLPDSDLIRERIQTRFNIPSNKSFDLLSVIGADCVGALQLLTQPDITHIDKIQSTPIGDHAIATLLKHYKTAPLGMDRETEFRISIAGAQEKTALLWHKNKWHLPKGTTPTSHIIKLPIGEIKHAGIDLSQSVENEWLCLKILSAFELPVNTARIIQFDDMKTLVVERFDRRWSIDNKWLMRLPQEDCCQALGKPGVLKYESDGGPGIQDIMKLLQGANQATQDRTRFMKSVFLFWVLGAIDGHAKNFSINIESQGRYQLTPLYDVISAYPIIANHQLAEQKIKMAMSLKSKNKHYLWSTIQKRHWIAMAHYCQFAEREMEVIIEEVCDKMENVIDQVKTILPVKFPQAIAETIFSGMQKIKKRLAS